MKQHYIILFLFLTFFTQLVAQNTYNLDATGTSRFPVTDKVWPANVGEADVCLWSDDKLAAFTVTIDDNNEQNIPFWKTMITKYGFSFTWFVITEAAAQYNVSDWDNYREVAALGSQVNGHDDRNWYNNPTGGQTNPTDAEYYARLLATQNKVNTEVTTGDNDCLTYAYPFGEGNEVEARKLYIAMRGVTGILNHADKVNYLDVNSVSSPAIYDTEVKRDTYILPLMNTSSTLFGTNYYRGWGSTHFHSVSVANESTVDDFLQYLEDKTDLWVAGFTQVSQYSQSFATHVLNVDSVNATEVKFTLTDDMLNSAFDLSLSVKVRIDNSWVSVSAVQNGSAVDAQIITDSGNKYALVKAVPDNGQVTLTGAPDSDPAVITPVIGDRTMVEGDILQIDFSASTMASDAISFTIENLPSFGTFTDNNDNTGSIEFNPVVFDAGVFPNITVVADNGRSTTTEVFQLTVTPDPSVLSIDASNQDAAVYFPEHGFVDPNNRTFAIGGGGYVAGKQMSPVFPFQLPALPSGQEVVAAKFVVNLESFVNSNLITGDLDLYGLPNRVAATVLVTDGYAGTYDADATATGLQQDFAGSITSIGLVETTSVGNTNLINYLNNEYQSASTGDYVFMRLSNDDVSQNQFGRILFSTADGAVTPTLLLQFGIILGVEDVDNTSFNVYPNPIKDGRIKISTIGFESENLNFEVYSVTGNLVKKGIANRVSNTTFEAFINLKSGLYIIQLTDGNRSKKQKLIIQ